MRSRMVAFLAFVWVFAAAGSARAEDDVYDVMFDVRLVPTERAARVSIHIGDGSELVSQFHFRIDSARHFDFKGDGEISISEDTVSWIPPREGGVLHYTFLVDHLRDDRSYDARITKSWALFRGDDLVPPTRTRAEKGARSRSRLRLRVPEGWTRAVPYPLVAGGVYAVNNPDRLFDRPTGWMLAGDLGAVREEVNGVEVAIAGPVQHGLRRLDMLALLRWTFPTLEKVLVELPPRLLIVGAGDPMWRGGLSGPNSVYVHSRRPLIAEDGTSPPLHEVMHAMLAIRPGPGGDWLVEGLAEYYSLELLRRSGTLSEKRTDAVYARLAKRGRKARVLETDNASGDVVAKAVTVLRALDAEIQERSEGVHSLDIVIRSLNQSHAEITTESFRTVVTETTGLSDLSSLDGVGVAK